MAQAAPVSILKTQLKPLPFLVKKGLTAGVGSATFLAGPAFPRLLVILVGAVGATAFGGLFAPTLRAKTELAHPAFVNDLGVASAEIAGFGRLQAFGIRTLVEFGHIVIFPTVLFLRLLFTYHTKGLGH